MLLGTLGSSLLGDLLTKNLPGKGTVRAGEGFLRAGEGIKKKALMPAHPSTNFEIQEYYKNEPKAIKNGAYIVNLDEYLDSGTHWTSLYL